VRKCTTHCLVLRRLATAWLLLASVLPLVTGAQMAVDGAEQRLAAVRDALLNHALNGELEIATAAFVDETGELHESTYMESNSTVRGIRITDYLHDEGHSPALAAEILDQVETQTCHPSRYRRHAVLETRIGQEAQLNTSIHAVGQVIRETLLQTFGADQSWLVTNSQAFTSQYDRVLRGTADQSAALRIEVALEASGGGVVASGYYQARRAVKNGMRYLPFLGYRPEPTARPGALSYQLRLIDAATGKVLFLRKEVVGFTEALDSVKTDLPADLIAALDAATERQVASLRDAARCLPNAMSVTRVAATSPTLLLQSGALAGVAMGDEFLLSDSRDLLAMVLNGDGISRLALGRVTRVSDFSAVLEVVAGERVPGADYVAALPF